MGKIKITEKEYNTLTQRLEFFDTMRNNLLTFSFTSVLAILGVALAMEMDEIGVWICLIPFFLIIPFTARISYYRLASAHINSFLKRFRKEDMQFSIGSEAVTEGICKHYTIMAWLVNHEMLLLGMATTCIFYLKYIICVEKWTRWNYVSLVIPIILNVIVFVISNSTYNYKRMMNDFLYKWNEYEPLED